MMTRKFQVGWLLFLFGVTMFVSCKHTPAIPNIQYDQDAAQLRIIQSDTSAHDSLFLDIDEACHHIVIIRDTIVYPLKEFIKGGDLYQIAYMLSTNNNTLQVKMRTSRTNDTLLQYHFVPKEIQQIKVAKVVSGQCASLYDVNYNRNFLKKIRQWFFKKNITPNDSIIQNMNSIIHQLTYTGKNEYAPRQNEVPTVSSTSGLKFRFDVDLPGDYFYLYSFPCMDGSPIKNFVEKKIADNFKDAFHSTRDIFTSANNGALGPNILFMIGIDKNWNYDFLPVGIYVIDNVPPKIYSELRRNGPYAYSTYFYDLNIKQNKTWPNVTTIPSKNMMVHLPNFTYSNAVETVKISTEYFQGDDYNGYNIPFVISTQGYVRYVTIGNHRITLENSYLNEKRVKLRIKGIHTGSNRIPLSATDTKGNKSEGSMQINLVPLTSSRQSDYDDLEERIDDLEDRLSDLEN